MAEKYLNPEGLKKLCEWVKNKFCSLVKFNEHNSDSIKHITSAERTNWNGKTKTTFSRSLNSGTKIGTITVDGTATDFFCEKNTDTTYSDMTGATASAAGAAGLVPAPAKGNQTKYLRGDGTWQTPPDTNTTYSAATQSAAGLMSADDKKKLDGVASGANAYTHPSTSGNKHIPAGGASGQILRWSADGTAVWGADSNTTYSNMKGATASADGAAGLVPAPTKGNQTKYLRGDGTWQTPPDTNTTYSAATQSAAGLMSADDKKKLDGIAAETFTVSQVTLYKKETKFSTDKTAIGNIHIVMSNSQYVNMYVTFNKITTITTTNQLVSDNFSTVKIHKSFGNFWLYNGLGSFSGSVEKETSTTANEIWN